VPISGGQNGDSSDHPDNRVGGLSELDNLNSSQKYSPNCGSKFCSPKAEMTTKSPEHSGQFVKQAENERKASEARREVHAEFKEIATELEAQFHSLLAEVEGELYTPIEREIAEARRVEEEVIASSNDGVGDVLALRGRLENLLTEISQLAG